MTTVKVSKKGKKALKQALAAGQKAPKYHALTRPTKAEAEARAAAFKPKPEKTGG